ncbi:hypothetical protein K435DRAFT_805760 [Dendrothele bispora CBS 962.96]|uniref:F-box domain-containing protein n=1 Tax=Dendrothele bispora (strain CBS 962.96) TaxID=1314807 RepID=A0A4V6T547_DENBC|nr:hypothetical protein K435DRAFT_805760 [Dendrothele bispora CBS 962.96]
MPPARFKHAESIELSSKTKGKARAVAAIPFSDADNDNDEYPGPKEALTFAPRDIEIPWPELDKGVLVEEASGLNFELDDSMPTPSLVQSSARTELEDVPYTSPTISIVPDNILGRILRHACIDADFTAVLGYSQVSHLWRDVASSTPAIWSSLLMSFTCDEGVPPHHEVMVSTWLTKSGDLDIHITLHGLTTDTGIITPILPFAPRIASLNLQTPLSSLLSLSALPESLFFTRLRTFNSISWGHFYDSDLIDEEVEVPGFTFTHAFMERVAKVNHLLNHERRGLFSVASNLVSLSIHHRNHPGPDDLEPIDPSRSMSLVVLGSPSNWQRITSLDLKETHISIQVIHKILLECESLVFFDASITHTYITFLPFGMAQGRPEPHIKTLSSLVHFHLSYSLWDQEADITRKSCTSLLQSLRLPALLKIYLENMENPLPGLQSLASCPSPLRVISLNGCQLGDTSQDLINLLRNCHLLEELRIEENPVVVSSWFDLALVEYLTVESESSALPLLRDLDIKVRLPHFDSARSRQFRRVIFHPAILQMVMSRWKPGSIDEKFACWSRIWLCLYDEPEEFLSDLVPAYHDLTETGLKITLWYDEKMFFTVTSRTILNWCHSDLSENVGETGSTLIYL